MPRLLDLYAPAASSRYAPTPLGGSGGDGTGSAATAVSSSSWNNPTNSFTPTASMGGTFHNGDNWGYHYQMTVTLDGKIISSYTANGGGQNSSTSTWSPNTGVSTWSSDSSSWSNDSYLQNLVTTVSNGTKGLNWNTSTSSSKSSGHDQTNAKYNVSGSWSPSSFSESGTSAQSGTGTSTRSNTNHGSSSYAIPGGSSTGQWHSGTTAHNGYANNWQSTLGSDGIWMSSGSMSNHGSGTSYSSLSGQFGYVLTNSTPDGSGTVSGSGHNSSHQNGAWSSHQGDTYGTAGWHATGGQTSHSGGTSTSASHSRSSADSTTANSKSTGHWSWNYRGKGSNSYSASATLGSDGLWISSGSVSMQRGGGGQGTGGGDDTFATDSASGSSSVTGAGGSLSSSTSNSSSSSSAASKMNNGVWTPVSGKAFSSDYGKSTDSGSDGGEEKSVVVGDKLSGPWSISDSGNANFSTTVTSVLNVNGLWVTTGVATEGGSAKGSDSAKESGTESLTSSSGSNSGSPAQAAVSSGSDTSSGSLTIKESDQGKDSDHYSDKQTLTAGGGWHSASGTASSTSGSTSNSTSSDAGASSSTTPAGDSDDNWNGHGNEQVTFSGLENAKLGSDGVWVTSGSVTVKGSGGDSDSYGDKGKYQVSGDGSSSSGSSSGSGLSSSSGSSGISGSSNGWETGNDTSTSDSGSSSSNSFKATYSLGAGGTWNQVSGSMTATNTVTATAAVTGKGDLGSILAGGSDAGTWNMSGSDTSSNTVTETSTLGSGGVWTTTGTDTGSGGGNWSSGSQGDGAFSIDTGSVSSGDGDDESGTLTESGSDTGGDSDNFSFSLDSNGNWQVVSGSAFAHDTDTDDVSDDETDNYGEDTSGGEVSGSKVEDDSVDVTASANDSWTLGTNDAWTLASSSSNATETVNDTGNDNFSGGDPVTGTDQTSLQETLTSSNGGTPAVTALTETASGSFTETASASSNANGPPASFSINVGGDPSAPTTTVTETNTTDLNGLSSISADDLDSLDSALVTAIASADNSSPTLGSSTWTYNSAGDLLSATLTDSDGSTTAWTFNNDGQLTSRTLAYGTPEAATTTFGYDANGNLISVTDPDGNVTTYTYNAQNEETSMTDPLGNTQTMEYNAQGQLIEQTNRDGMYETYAYDAAGQMVQETWYAADGTETDQLNFSYNAAGQLLSAANDEGTYTFSYNAQGQVIGVTEPFGLSLTFAYDASGNRVEVQDSLGGTTQSSYDAANQLVSELFSEDGQPVLSVGESYNADGTVANLTYDNDADGTDVVATTAYGYDEYGNVTSIVQMSGSGTVLGDYTYSYDTNYGTSGSSLPSITLPSESTTSSGMAALLAAFLAPPQPTSSVSSETDNGVTTNYSYDGSGQLVSYGGTTQSYDLNGNPTGPGYAIGPDNQLLSDGTYNYTYDADGNEATKTNIATGDKWTYGYDNADQLVSAVETTASGVVETQVVMQYDVFGNLLQQQVWTPSSGWTTTRYAYDAWDPATPSGVGNENWKVWATLDGNNNLVTRYINGDALDQVFAQISASGSVAWYLTDRLGSTRALVDNNGNVLDAITYDARGNITSQTNPSVQPLFMFAGMAWDGVLQLYIDGNGIREYDPSTGRFIEQDPTQFRAGDSNLYRYVENDPTNAVDPSGLTPSDTSEEEIVWKVIEQIYTEEGYDLSPQDLLDAVAEYLDAYPYEVSQYVSSYLDLFQPPGVTEEDIDNIANIADHLPANLTAGVTIPEENKEWAREAPAYAAEAVKETALAAMSFLPVPETALFKLFSKFANGKGFRLIKEGGEWVLKKVLRKGGAEVLEAVAEKEGKALYDEFIASKAAAKGWDASKAIGKQLEGKGQLAGLRRNPNLRGVDLDALLKKTPAQLEQMVKDGELSDRALKQIKKAFEGRDLRHGK